MEYRRLTVHAPAASVVQLVVRPPCHVAETDTPPSGASPPVCAQIVTVIVHRREPLGALAPSRSPTCVVWGSGGGGGGGGAAAREPAETSTPNVPPRPLNGSPSYGYTRIVYVPATVGIACNVSCRPTPHSLPAAQVLLASMVPPGPRSSASRSGPQL